MNQQIVSPAPKPAVPAALMEAEVLSVHHWTDRLFSFTVTRDPAFRFENGQFVMVGLFVNGKPLLRAYSVASANYEETVEFFSIKVPDGPLTSRLQKIVPGDRILLGRKPTGTLLLDNLKPGKRLYMLSTGTGLAPFLSLVKDPAVYERFERVILTHSCRDASEFAYADWLEKGLPADEFLGDLVAGKFSYFRSTTRDDFPVKGRITDLIRNGGLAEALGLPALDPAEDRVMICGSEAMLADLKAMLEEYGFQEGNSNQPGDYVIEKAFVEK